jgi:hypothetical protein
MRSAATADTQRDEPKLMESKMRIWQNGSLSTLDHHTIIALAHSLVRSEHALLYMSFAYLTYAFAETAIIVFALSNGLFFKVGRALFRLIIILAIYSIGCIYLFEYFDRIYVS